MGARTKTKRASYREAIAWVAENDACGDDDACDLEVVESYLTVALVADLFGKTTEEVGQAVVAYRKRIHDSFTGKS